MENHHALTRVARLINLRSGQFALAEAAVKAASAEAHSAPSGSPELINATARYHVATSRLADIHDRLVWAECRETALRRRG